MEYFLQSGSVKVYKQHAHYQNRCTQCSVNKSSLPFIGIACVCSLAIGRIGSSFVNDSMCWNLWGDNPSTWAQVRGLCWKRQQQQRKTTSAKGWFGSSQAASSRTMLGIMATKARRRWCSALTCLLVPKGIEVDQLRTRRGWFRDYIGTGDRIGRSRANWTLFFL
jgi:hypothetical protein